MDSEIKQSRQQKITTVMLGKDWFDVKEGEASIFKPEGSKYQLIARVQMEDWPKLAVSAN